MLKKYLIPVVLCSLIVVSVVGLVNELKLRNAEIILDPIQQHTQDNSNIIPIQIEYLGLEIPITMAKIQNKKWEYSDSSVSFLTNSPIPGELGNSIMYGHNWPNLLGNLNKIKVGEKIKIAYSNGVIKEFTAISKNTVTPDQTHILNQTNDSRITLFTCAGFLDSKRLVVVFK